MTDFDKKMKAAIRQKCLDCCFDDKVAIAKCDMVGCSLWPYRFEKVENDPGREED